MTKRVLGITVAAAMLAAVPAAQAAPQTASFGVTGGDQMFTVPAGVTSVHVVAIGGSGGSTAAATGGTGARLTADVPVQGGQVLYVEVGGNGGNDGFNGRRDRTHADPSPFKSHPSSLILGSITP